MITTWAAVTSREPTRAGPKRMISRLREAGATFLAAMHRPASHKPRLLAVDLDGTLLDVHGLPHKKDLAALRGLQTAGIHVCVVTGRLYSGSRAIVETIGALGPVACADGSHIVDGATGSTLVHIGIEEPVAGALGAALRRRRPATFLFSDDAIIHDACGADFLAYMRTWSNVVLAVDDVHARAIWEERSSLTGVVAVGTAEQIAGSGEEIAASCAGSVQVVTFPLRQPKGHHGLVARATGATKGTALRWIASHHGVDLGECVAVGDWINDIPMLAAAGRSFAMGHAPFEVKRQATDVLDETSSDGGGVARVVERAFDIRDEGLCRVSASSD